MNGDMATNGEITTFWRFLCKTPVRIPIIQRDYAQGRKGKEELRKAFLKDLKQSLDSRARLKLDFVYGAAENDTFDPLDGQQRLTTLWLLHWYVAYMAGEIENAKDALSQFSYETRQSSRAFCEWLSSFKEPLPDKMGVVAHIQNQTRFRSSWRNDPTIAAMLRMLGGTRNGASDGIEGVFRKKPSEFPKYWNCLIGDDCPIVFHALNIYGIGQTDDLYIKMNARGKPLTSFENLKADLAGYIGRNATKESDVEGIWHEFAKPENGIAIKMDTDWMDGIFWKRKSPDFAVDEIYFAFLNRFFLNAHALNIDKSDVKKGEDETFDFFYGRNAKVEASDDQIAYVGFDSTYARVLENEPKLLKRLADTLDNYLAFAAQDESVFQPSWDKEGNFRFVPCYESSVELHYDFAGNEIRKIGKIIQPHRVVFHAVCKFFEQGWRDGDGDALKNWMRVVWNIVENANINTIPGMIGCLKLVDELAVYSHKILEGLKDQGASLKSDFAKDQVAEEIEKAKQILSDTTGAWKEKIEDAEKTAFFKGAIRFLYMNGNGEVDWNDFDVKFNNAKKFFDKDGVSNEYRKNALLLRAFLASEPLKAESGFWFGHGKVFWRNTVLLDASFTKAADELLKSEALPVSDKAAEWITDADLIADAINGDTGSPDGNWHILSNWKHGGDKTLTRYTNRVAGNVNYPNQIVPISGFPKDSLLNKRQVFLSGMKSPQRRGSKWFIGWNSDVNFEFNGYWFRWIGAPNCNEGAMDIYLLKNMWNDDEQPYAEHRHYRFETLKDDRTDYFCFNVTFGMTPAIFQAELKRLIVVYELLKMLPGSPQTLSLPAHFFPATTSPTILETTYSLSYSGEL